MILGELICSLGMGLLAPQNCITTDSIMVGNISCKRDDMQPVAQASKSTEEKIGSEQVNVPVEAGAIDQKCKAVIPK